MNPELFWLVGFLAIGIVTGIISKCYTVRTTADSNTAKGIVIWGCVIATLWFFYGGFAVLMHSLGK